MTANQVRIAMEKFQKMQQTTIEDKKFPVTAMIRLKFGQKTVPVTVNCLNFIGDGELHANYDDEMLIVVLHGDDYKREFIPFDSIGSIAMKMYSLDDKMLF